MAQISLEEAEKDIKKYGSEFNTSAVKLNEVELKLLEMKDECFDLLQQLYEQTKQFSSPTAQVATADLEKKYNDSYAALAEQESDHYNAVLVCFRQLQRLNHLQNAYSAAIINGLQKELNEVKPPKRADNILPSQDTASPT